MGFEIRTNMVSLQMRLETMMAMVYRKNISVDERLQEMDNVWHGTMKNLWSLALFGGKLCVWVYLNHAVSVCTHHFCTVKNMFTASKRAYHSVAKHENEP